MRGNLIKMAISTALSKGFTITEINNMSDDEIQQNRQIPNKLKHVLITLKNTGDLNYYETADPESDWVIANRLAKQFEDPELIDQYVKEQKQKEKPTGKINKKVQIAGRNISISEEDPEEHESEQEPTNTNIITDEQLREIIANIKSTNITAAVKEVKDIFEGKEYNDMMFSMLIQEKTASNFKQRQKEIKKQRQANATAVKDSDTVQPKKKKIPIKRKPTKRTPKSSE